VASLIIVSEAAIYDSNKFELNEKYYGK